MESKRGLPVSVGDGMDATRPATPTYDVALPERIGDYRILRCIGRGGMGIVYEAEQSNPRRIVALKVVQALSTQTRRRFERETAVLGCLQHPGIAQIYAAGIESTQSGEQPYFAMEYVRGQSLLHYIHERKLGVRERLELLVQVCDAVHYAHTNGVIHRDLKPGNILVNTFNQAKVLDFGVARLTNPDLHATTMQTGVGQLIGTVPYMSPEQAGGELSDLDVRSDVYALGVLAYEMLTGRLPYELPNSIPLALRVIREEEPSRLTIASDGSAGGSRLLRGDIETIIFKALEKDRTRRYASVSALCDDIQRVLNSEPIHARPPSSWYRLQKFAVRNRALVGGILAVLVTLLIGLGTTTWWALRATQAEETASIALTSEQRALQEARSAQQQVQARLAESLAQSARLAEQRGDWATALQYFDRALAAGYPDSVEMQLGRIKSLYSVELNDRCLELAESLADREDLGEHRGSVLLWLGYLTMHLSVSGTEEGIDWVQEALECGTLSESEHAFASGLLAETMPESVRHFRTALNLDPFNRPAVVMLGLMELMLGKVEESRYAVRTALNLKPDDIVLRTLYGLLSVFARDTAAVEECLQLLTDEVTPEHHQAITAAYDVLTEAMDVLDQVSNANLVDNSVMIDLLNNAARTAILCQKAAAYKDNPLTRLGSMLPPTFARLRDYLLASSGALFTQNYSKAADYLIRCNEIAPSGHLYLFQGIMLRQAQRYDQAAQAFHLALTTPAFMDVRCPAAFGSILTEMEMYTEILEQEFIRPIDYFSPETINSFVERYLDACAFSQSGWNASTVPLLVNILVSLREPEQARILAIAALKLDPDNPKYFYCKALAEYYMGAYGVALTTLDDLLAIDPEHNEGLSLKELANQSLGKIGTPYDEHDTAQPKPKAAPDR
jgi:serine/threonine protein kinase